jgi:chloramphenicol 3-O phosphotransferase
MPGRVIYLNGTSSAGKSTLASALQDSLEGAWLRTGIDAFLDMLPFRYRANHPEGTVFAMTDAGMRVSLGPVAERAFRGMYATVAALARANNDVIFDDVLLSREMLQAAVASLDGIEVLLVKVDAPVEVLEQRERSRGDRFAGLARGMREPAHAHGVYDVEFDNSVLGLQDCVKLIQQRLQDGPPPTAFETLRRRFAGQR